MNLNMGMLHLDVIHTPSDTHIGEYVDWYKNKTNHQQMYEMAIQLPECRCSLQHN